MVLIIIMAFLLVKNYRSNKSHSYFHNKTNEMHQFLKFILFCSSTLRVSDSLSFHHQESKAVHTASGICQTDSADCLLAGKRCSIFSSTLHVSEGLSVHHQESKAVHTASGMCHTDSADCLLAGTRCSIL